MTHFTGPNYVTPDYPPTYWMLVERAAESLGETVVLADDYGRELSARGVRDAALSAAAGLYERGIGRDSKVSWQLPSTLEGMIVKLALARLGAVQNPIIPALREAEVEFITDQVGASHLLVPEEWRGFAHGQLARDLSAKHGLETVIVDHHTDPTTTGGALRLPGGDIGSLPPAPDYSPEARWLYFSSGTTAAPKGVQHSDRSVLASASGVLGQLGVGTGDIYPIAFPITHIGGATMLAASLLTGMRLVLFDIFDPSTAGERMAGHDPTLLGTAVPFFLVFMNAQKAHGDERLFPLLRACVGGGAPVPAEVNQAVRETLGVSGVANAWGLTEFPVAASPRPTDPAEWLDRTVGMPVPGVTLRVVAEDERELEVGEEGELRLKGPQCFAGYLDQTLDADAFDENGWFRTGDLGLVDTDGNVHITGRIKDLIIRNAENISASEVEEVLFRYDRITDVAVIGLPDKRTGERVCAVVVLADDGDLTVQEVLDHCTQLGLARMKIPERVEVVATLSRNSLGKVPKAELRRQFS